MKNEAIAAADALGAGMAARSAALIEAAFDDEVRIFHGATGREMGKQENLGLLAGLFHITSSLAYRDIRRDLIADGLVQQHRVCGAFSDGEPLPELNACMIIRVRNALIVRVEEYFDGQTFAEVWARLAALSATGKAQ